MGDSNHCLGHGFYVSSRLQAGENLDLKVKDKGEKEEKQMMKRDDGQSDLLRVKSIKVHQIVNSCFLKVTNLCWKLSKMEGE